MKLDDIVRKRSKGLKRELWHLSKRNRSKEDNKPDQVGDGDGDLATNDDDAPRDPDSLPHF